MPKITKSIAIIIGCLISINISYCSLSDNNFIDSEDIPTYNVENISGSVEIELTPKMLATGTLTYSGSTPPGFARIFPQVGKYLLATYSDLQGNTSKTFLIKASDTKPVEGYINVVTPINPRQTLIGYSLITFENNQTLFSLIPHPEEIQGRMQSKSTTSCSLL